MRIAKKNNSSGFTIVELLIVIIVIGILSTLVLVAYNNVQTQAKSTKVTHDLRQLNDIIRYARSQTGKPLIEITGNYATMLSCYRMPDGTDLAKLPKTDKCWTDYFAALTAIGAAADVSADINLSNLTDPYGRPYYIDENDAESTQPACTPDVIAEYSYPYKYSSKTANTAISIKPYTYGC